jgi:hypothetical protein
MPSNRILWTILIIVAAALAAIGSVDSLSKSYAERTLKNALVTFAIARTMNGVISVAQGSEVALEPGGVGVTLAVGEVLDPVNDLIERFSSVMLVAASSLGLQLIVLEISGWWGITALVVIAAIVAVVALWAPELIKRRHAALTLRFLIVFLFLRFAVPLLIIGTTLISDTFLQTEQAALTAALEATTTEIEAINSETDASAAIEGKSFLDRVSDMIDESVATMRVGERLGELTDKASQASEHIVKLIAIFVLQTILMPVALLWLIIEGMKALIARSARSMVEKPFAR